MEIYSSFFSGVVTCILYCVPFVVLIIYTLYNIDMYNTMYIHAGVQIVYGHVHNTLCIIGSLRCMYMYMYMYMYMCVIA